MRTIHETLTLCTLALAPLALWSPGVAAEADDDERPFAQAEIFFELNDTDGDLGIHAAIDGEAWRRLVITDPDERNILDIRVQRRLRRQGLTQIAFESAEPTFDELDPATFFQRFPEGEYEIEGVTLDGDELESTATLSHVLPAPVGNVQVSGLPVPEDCDLGPVPVVAPPVVVTWDPVVDSHPELGKPGAIEVVRYQLFAERAGFKLSLDLPPTVTEAELPATALAPGEYKLEIIVREASGNNTALESCFELI